MINNKRKIIAITGSKNNYVSPNHNALNIGYITYRLRAAKKEIGKIYFMNTEVMGIIESEILL